MLKKLAIGAGITVAIIIVGMFLLSKLSCLRIQKPTNQISQLHLTIEPYETLKPNWEMMKRAYEIRTKAFGELRHFNPVQDSYAVVEIAGATDPSTLASMLITQGHIIIKTQDDKPIAQGEEISSVVPIGFTNEDRIGLQITLKENAIERLKSTTSSKSMIGKDILLQVDDTVLCRFKIIGEISDGNIDFRLPKGTTEYEAQLATHILLVELPFKLGIHTSYSYFVPPLSENKTELSLTNILEDIASKK
jgi:hypothetical protein